MTVRDEWALCIGGADCIWDDVLAFEELYGKQWDGLVIAANDIGSHWPRDLHHWVSLHPGKFERWKALRVQQQLPATKFTTWTRKMRMAQERLADNEVEPWSGGSSGMLAVQVAQDVGCTRVILCGIPMTMTLHFAQTDENFHAQWLAANGHWRGWGRCKEQMEGWVRSMSGRTRELLGAPTLPWLHGDSSEVHADETNH